MGGYAILGWGSLIWELETLAAQVRGAAYAIACLAEQNADFQAIGFPRSRARAARGAAARIARGLAEEGRV